MPIFQSISKIQQASTTMQKRNQNIHPKKVYTLQETLFEKLDGFNIEYTKIKTCTNKYKICTRNMYKICTRLGENSTEYMRLLFCTEKIILSNRLGKRVKTRMI